MNKTTEQIKQDERKIKADIWEDGVRHIPHIGESMAVDKIYKIFEKYAEEIVKSTEDRKDREFEEKFDEILCRKEPIHGYQPYGYTDEHKEQNIFFDGFNNGRALLKIDILSALNNKKDE